VRRRQLIEIEDQSWCPAAVRDGLTDYLQFITDHTEPYAPAARLLADALRVGTGDGTSEPPIPVVDLGSGGGGPWRRLVRRLHDAGVPVRVRLTDLHPNLAAFDGVVSCLRTYTPDELRELAKSVDGATGYDWTAGHAGGGPIPMTYLVGTPVRRHGAAP
jgi:hypothetical protein